MKNDIFLVLLLYLTPLSEVFVTNFEHVDSI